jgi:hypothetical protein
MKARLSTLVAALGLAVLVSLPATAEAGHRHGNGCGHRGYERGYYGGHRGHSKGGYYKGGYYRGPYGYAHGYRPYPRRYYAAPPPYAYGYAPYGYYPPPPPVYYDGRPRVGISLHFGF